MQKKVGQLIPEETLSQIRLANDVVDLIGTYVSLRRSGASFKGLCPFHEEKTPSFNVNPQRQTYHCFGCGASGNAISFIMAVEKLDFLDAVRQLADRAGIRLQPADPREAAEESHRATLLSTIEWATRFFETTLRSPAGVEARRYLQSRRIAPEVATAFRLGFALPSWDGLLRAAKEKGISTDLLLAAGLVVPREEPGGYYDRFRGRLIFPIFDLRGRPVAFGARSLDGSEPKYLNSPETALFSKGRVLYGLHAAREAAQRGRSLAIVEGYTDVLMAHQLGFAPVVATLGTALTRDHAKLVRRFADDIRLVYDADEGGERASERGIEIFLEEGLEVRIASLPDGLDPCDLLLRDGVDAFRLAIDAAREYVDYAIDAACRRHRIATVSGRAAAAEELLALAQKLGDPIRQDLVVRRIAGVLGIGEAALRERLRRDARRPAASSAEASSGGSTAPPARRRVEEELLAGLLSRPDRLAAVAADLSADTLENRDLAEVFETVLAVARQGETPTSDRVLLNLGSDDARRLASSLYAHDFEPGKEESHFQGALEYLQRRQQKLRLENIRSSRLDASRQGDAAAVDAWLRATESELKRR